jgi:hypothetical protein
MQPRTEDDILAKTPVSLRLGAKDYAVPILTILPARAWRMKLDQSCGDIVRNFQPEVDKKAFATGLTGALIHFPEKIAELVFAYANGWEGPEALGSGKKKLEKPLLPEEEIMANATEEQLAAAFSQIMAVAYPFLPQLALVRQAVLGSLRQRANSTTLQ